MRNHPATLDQQIAALETALQLPLPAATRAQLEQDLRALHERRSTSGASVQGIADVSSTLHGNAIGVNFGTVQTAFGAKPFASGDRPTADLSTETIDDQRALLDALRHTLTIYLKQRATLGSAHAPPGVEHGIREARAAIRRVKATLRGWNLAVDDHPDDEAPPL